LANSSAKWIGWGTPEHRPGWVDESPFPHLGVIGHFNNILIQFEATKLAAGIGHFPCFIGDNAPELLRLSDPVPSLEVWLLSHRDLRAAARMRAFRQFIIQHIPHIKATLEGKFGNTVACADI